jgi:hypothetical protein
MEDFRKHPFVTGVPRFSQIDFYSLVSFSKQPLYQLVPAVALRLAVLLFSWALDSSSAFVYYLKACKAQGNTGSKIVLCTYGITYMEQGFKSQWAEWHSDQEVTEDLD